VIFEEIIEGRIEGGDSHRFIQNKILPVRNILRQGFLKSLSYFYYEMTLHNNRIRFSRNTNPASSFASTQNRHG
jgi:hypothetical protein